MQVNVSLPSDLTENGKSVNVATGFGRNSQLYLCGHLDGHLLQPVSASPHLDSSHKHPSRGLYVRDKQQPAWRTKQNFFVKETNKETMGIAASLEVLNSASTFSKNQGITRTKSL